MLYNAHNGYARFAGEPVHGLILPGNVETVWTAAELVAIGLWPVSEIAPADAVPEGKISIGQHVEEIEGVPTFVHDLVDAPEPEPERLPDLKPYQFWAVMRATGHEAGLRAWVANLNDPGPDPENPTNPNYDPLAWANASAIIDFSLEYRRDHPLVDAARQVMGVDEEELDDLWRYAATL